jgi:hypothetical protein
MSCIMPDGHVAACQRVCQPHRRSVMLVNVSAVGHVAVISAVNQSDFYWGCSHWRLRHGIMATGEILLLGRHVRAFQSISPHETRQPSSGRRDTPHAGSEYCLAVSPAYQRLTVEKSAYHLCTNGTIGQVVIRRALLVVNLFRRRKSCTRDSLKCPICL